MKLPIIVGALAIAVFCVFVVLLHGQGKDCVSSGGHMVDDPPLIMPDGNGGITFIPQSHCELRR